MIKSWYFHSIFEIIPGNRSQQNVAKGGIIMIEIYEEEHGENEDEKFPTSRSLLFSAIRNILMKSLNIIWIN